MSTDELIQRPPATSADWALHAAALLREQGRLETIAGAQTEAALAWAALCYDDLKLPVGTLASSAALDVAQVLVTIGADPATRLAALLAWLPMADGKSREALRQRAGPEVAALVEGTARLDSIQTLSEVGEAGTTPAQQESLRKMLLAMVQDIRTVLIKLAQELVTLRTLTRHPDEALRRRHARVTLDLFAPLANRLGVWQLKWEMEDLAFRLSDPATYKRIAKLLDEKRAARQQTVDEVMQILRADLAAAGIAAKVTGRPKHIYSIWRKMGRKGLEFGDLYDVFGVRVLVDEVKDCYAALGLVHHRWTPVPKEFDDYIAKPKGNDYRSLHTAVIGPGDRAVEVQIRTHAMHQHAELGVAAHWAYKEAGSKAAGSDYDQRIAWLRRILDWRDTVVQQGGQALGQAADAAPGADDEAPASIGDRFKTELFSDVVYALSPQGRVVDLPAGSTPVDFAYALHTELGHRCRGAKVDGAMVPLTFPLANGQTVEIITTREGGPSRDWLNPQLGFTRSSRARNKVRQWFNAQNLATSIAQGRALVERELQRLGIGAYNLDQLPGRLGIDKLDEAFAAIARGEVNQRQLQVALREPAADAGQPYEPPDVVPIARRSEAGSSARGILVVGVDKLLTVLAKCCKPAPPDPIVGFVSRGRGVTVHRRDCPNVSRMPQERMIESGWGRPDGERFAVDLEVLAHDRQGLLRDISELLSREKVNVTATQTASRSDTAHMMFTVEVRDVSQVQRLLAAIGEVKGVIRVRRR
ncbi:MAG: bifunctional (p)ppGpp synthetase/guanosine-3',5'-bis(diphosphate) 3'-pyrophosphohydrolase [Burkholderiales bacterium]|nr:bifunctional (p)ppGpp synthetase/guanosine-3',5'-bis(diphosphate) 3'-pyrophosphohydrolase [Burkholderiales bacterium]